MYSSIVNKCNYYLPPQSSEQEVVKLLCTFGQVFSLGDPSGAKREQFLAAIWNNSGEVLPVEFRYITKSKISDSSHEHIGPNITVIWDPARAEIAPRIRTHDTAVAGPYKLFTIVPITEVLEKARDCLAYLDSQRDVSGLPKHSSR